MRQSLLFLALLAGCKTLDLPERYRPLETLSEGNFLGDHTATTVGTTVYVEDLADWDLEDPLTHAVLLHERVHAIRQIEAGVASWAWDYLTDPDFAWREEQLGWAVQIAEWRRAGIAFDAPALAKVLHDYPHPLGPIVSESDALEWIRQQ